MATNIDKYRADLKSLIELGRRMSVGLWLPSKDPQERTKRTKKQSSETDKVLDEYFENARGSFAREYQRWYTEACAVIRQLIPDRSAEFEYLYKGDGKRKTIDIRPTQSKTGLMAYALVLIVLPAKKCLTTTLLFL